MSRQHFRETNSPNRQKVVITSDCSIFYLFPLDLVLLAPFPNDFPSNPGRDFPLTPLCFSFLFSFLLAILSARFFCRAAIFAESCSFRSVLRNYENRTPDKNENRAYQAFLLFVFSFSFRLADLFNRVSSSATLAPSIRAVAFSHFSRSSICLRFSSGRAASFSFRDVSCCRA